jgi:precorrin-2 dehydrogenase/sirohydrochlorin ferrochelatase
MGFYPIVLELEGRPCLVVGGGAVAERKVDSLLGAGARVTVVGPTATPRLEGLAREGRIRLVARAWEGLDLPREARRERLLARLRAGACA